MKKFITGDLHGDGCGELKCLSSKNWKEQKLLTKEDVLFQLGDFGFYFSYPKYHSEYKKEYNRRKELAAKKYTLFIIPGNHENYDLIEKLPIIEKWGGLVHEEKFGENSLYIARRGEIYLIDGKKYFTFGGALSADIDYRFSMDDLGKMIRQSKSRYGQHLRYEVKKIKISQISYWKRELPSEEEYKYALENLSKHNYKVDYILTHTCPISFVGEFIHKTEYTEAKFYCPVANFLEDIYLKTEFKHWYFGHMHTNYTLNNELTCHYSAIPIEIDT